MNAFDEFKENYSGEIEKFEVPPVEDDFYMSAAVWIDGMKKTLADTEYALEYYAKGKTSGLNNLTRMSTQTIHDYSRQLVYDALRLWSSSKRTLDKLPEEDKKENLEDFI